MEFWHVFSIVIAAVLLGAGLIMGWGWLVGIGLAAIPLAAIWGLVSTGPGSAYNPYHHH